MNTSRKARRRIAATTSLKALITSASLAAVLGGWVVLSAPGRSVVTATLPSAPPEQSALPTPPQDNRVQPVQPSVPTGRSFNSPPSFSNPAPTFRQPMARTHSSR